MSPERVFNEVGPAAAEAVNGLANGMHAEHARQEVNQDPRAVGKLGLAGHGTVLAESLDYLNAAGRTLIITSSMDPCRQASHGGGYGEIDANLPPDASVADII